MPLSKWLKSLLHEALAGLRGTRLSLQAIPASVILWACQHPKSHSRRKIERAVFARCESTESCARRGLARSERGCSGSFSTCTGGCRFQPRHAGLKRLLKRSVKSVLPSPDLAVKIQAATT